MIKDIERRLTKEIKAVERASRACLDRIFEVGDLFIKVEAIFEAREAREAEEQRKRREELVAFIRNVWAVVAALDVGQKLCNETGADYDEWKGEHKFADLTEEAERCFRAGVAIIDRHLANPLGLESLDDEVLWQILKTMIDFERKPNRKLTSALN